MSTSSQTAPMDGRIAFITGAASGIGLATALQFARDGAAAMTLLDRDMPGLEAAARRIEELGCRVLQAPGDLTDEDFVADSVARTIAAFHGLDAVVNSAGIAGGGQLHELDLSMWDRLVAVNLTGLLICLKHELAQLRQLGRPATVVNVASSLGGFVTIAGNGAYSATKAAVVVLTKTAALENSSHQIRVSAVAPGITRTAMTRDMAEDRRSHLVDLHPLGRFGESEEIASAITWLSSEASSFATGTILAVDGGFSAGSL